MKILYHHRVRSKDGQGVHIKELIAALRDVGHEVEIVEPAAFRRAPFGDHPSTLDWLKRNIPKGIFEVLELAYNVPAYIRLHRASQRCRPDIIYERYSLYLLAGLLVSWSHRTPLLLEVNAPLAEERAKFGGIGFPRMATFLEGWAWRAASHVLPVTQVLANKVITAGVPRDRISVIGNGINQRSFASLMDLGQAKASLGLSDKIVLGFTGFMREWHRLDAIIDLIASGSVPTDLHFLIVGDGPARSQLDLRAQQLGVASRVTFTGLVDHQFVGNIVAAFDIALQPAAVDYASPLKLFEYMALGKAIIAPDQPNIREVLTHGSNALLFEPDSAAAMAIAVERLSRDRDLRERIGRAALDTITCRRLTWEENARRISKIAASTRHVGQETGMSSQ